jgi:hypothetical protein
MEKYVMPCRPLKSIDFQKFQTPAQVLRELQDELEELREIAIETNFQNKEEANQFSRNVLYLKMYFEKYERLLRDE